MLSCLSKSGCKFIRREADTCHLSATLSLCVVFTEGKPMFRHKLFRLVPSGPLLSVFGRAASVGKLSALFPETFPSSIAVGFPSEQLLRE